MRVAVRVSDVVRVHVEVEHEIARTLGCGNVLNRHGLEFGLLDGVDLEHFARGYHCLVVRNVETGWDLSFGEL